MSDPEWSEARDFAWRYFEYHAEQRLKAFNFYLVISAFIIGGFITLLESTGAQGQSDYLWAIPLTHSFLSFVFWRLDRRNSKLVKNGENALRYLDTKRSMHSDDPAAISLKIFESDDREMASEKLIPGIGGRLSYSVCFKLVFGIFGFGSLLAAANQFFA